MVIHSSIRLEQGLIPVPFVPVKRPILPAIIGGAALLGSAIYAGASASSSSKRALQATEETNNVNRQIAADVNKANLDLYREQYANSVEQWNRQNAYNDPSAQAARLRAAGFNPALTFGGDNTAGSVALPSASPAVGYTHQTAPYEMYSDTFVNGLLNSLPPLADSIEKAVGSYGQSIDNQYKAALNKQTLKQISADIDNKISDALAKKAQKGVSEATIKKIDSEINHLNVQRESVDWMNKITSAQYDDLVNTVKLQNKYLTTQDRVLSEQNARDNARLAIENYQALTGRMMTNAQISQINVLSRLAQNADFRESQLHSQKLVYGEMENVLKSLQIPETQKQNLFNTIVRDSELMHLANKDASLLNHAAELMFGFGFRDLGAMIKGFIGK